MASPEEIDRYIVEQRSQMASLFDAVIYHRSRTLLDVFEQLTVTCKSSGAEHNETRSVI